MILEIGKETRSIRDVMNYRFLFKVYRTYVL